jgi:hypothetical protein
MSRCHRGSTLLCASAVTVIDTPMCFCGDSCNLVRCEVLGYAYGMRFFMCDYADDSIQPFDRNLRAKVKTYYISQLFICHL